MKRTPLAMLIALSLIAAVALPAAAPAADPFEIYVSLPITGQGGFLGSETAKGITALEGYVNKTGGIRGRPVKFVIADDQSNPQIEVQVLSQILPKKPAVIIGGELAAMCNAGTGLIKEEGPVYYCFSSGVHPAPGSWIYSASFSTVDMVAVSIKYLRERGMTKIATITTTDASGQDGDKTIDEALARPENKGVTLAAREHLAPTDISVAAQLTRVKNSGAQALIAWTSGTPLGTVLRGVRDGGYDFPVVTTPANLVYKQLDQYKSVMPNAPLYIPGIPSVVPDAIGDRGVRRSIDAFYTEMKQQGVPKPDVAASIAWDVGRVIVEGYRKLGVEATPAQMREYINDTRGFPNVLGTYDYKNSPQRGAQPQWLLMVRWDPDNSKFIAVSKLGGDPTGK
jgi:branched-chain amino acid transport system substrate-binding protein